jgi:hypothetical protein
MVRASPFWATHCSVRADNPVVSVRRCTGPCEVRYGLDGNVMQTMDTS